MTSNDYEHFLSTLLPEIIKLLETVPISFSTASMEQRFRSCLLDIILRLQTNDTLKPHAITILELLMNLLQNENEDNGVQCMKILTSLHRAYKVHLVDQVQPFLDLVIEIYKNIPQVVKDTFNTPNAQSLPAGTPPVSSFQSPKPLSPSTGSDFSSIEPSAKTLSRSMYSFKVLTECPIIIVLLYSTHKTLVNQSLPVFIPHIIEMLSLEAAPQAKAHAAAKARGEVHTSVSPQIKNRAAYGEFIVAQVKTMSFLAYALRGFSAALEQYHSRIPDFVVRLLQDCPCELSAARKELLVATRHILSTDFRTIFIPKVDILLNEKVLIGEGLTVHETLRPLAYSTMADLVHHVRAELTPEQILKTVRVYCKNMQDDTLATSFQIMSAKLLLNLVERIMKLKDKNEGRQIMVLILNAFVERFTTLNRNYAHIMKKHRDRVKKDKEDQVVQDDSKMEIDNQEPDAEKEASEEPDFVELVDDKPIKIHADTGNDDLKDARYIFKNLMNFLKTVMFGLKSCNPPPPQGGEFTEQQWQECARVFNYEQITIFRRLFREGISGHLFFSAGKESESTSTDDTMKQTMDISTPNLLISSSKDEKDLMEAFATVFIHIDSASFNEIIDAELPYLFDAMFENPALLHIPQFFLASESTSANFLGVLIIFLKDRLPELGSGNSVKSNILIRLFKLCFMAVNLFPAVNETILLPQLRDLIIGSLELTTTAKEPIVYFNLLRTLFRSIGGGRFELLYKEVLPLLQVLLESLNRLLNTARKPQERDIYVELCLTVPVRLSVLVPHLSYLMRPLVLALNGNQELVSQGLRTLELCVDNLTAEYFDPIIEPVIGEVMEALFKHLRPLPYNHQHSHTTLRILGKLGGRNRRYLTPPGDLEHLSTLTQELNAGVLFDGISDEKPLNLAPGVATAISVLGDSRNASHYRVEAYRYLSGVLKLFIDSTEIPSDMAERIQRCVNVILDTDFPLDDSHLPDGNVDAQKKKNQNQLVENVIEAIFAATALDEIREEVLAFIKDICEHFTILELGEIVIEKRKIHRTFDLDEHEGHGYIDPKSLLGAIVYALSHYDSRVKDSGQMAIRWIYETGKAMFGDDSMVHRFPLFRALFGKLSHSCFEQEYYRKAGACLGMKTVIRDLGLPLDWIHARQLEFVRTMFFVLKDVPSEMPSSVRTEASDLMCYVLKESNKDMTEEKINNRAFKQVMGVLAYELGNANEAVRDTSKRALLILSETANKSIAELLSPVKSILLTPIFGKPLRALPFPMQIGHIDAITYCLGLKDTFLEFSEELTRLLLEALALVDAEDESLTSSHKVFEYRTSDLLVQLRIVCIRLLSLALTTSDYLTTQQPQTKTKIIAVFFKTLYSRSSKVVDAAHSGLGAVLSQNAKLPKDLLQNGLRPILVNLSDHKRLTVPGLEGLARLLELLTSYFKVEIGNKLLDHLNAWADPVQLQAISIKRLSSQQNVRVIVAILNVFHLLPDGAHCFMKQLVEVVQRLESSLRRQQFSPFREPIAKFLNRYPEKACEFFAPLLSDRWYGRFFTSILSMDSCKNLRKVARDQITTFEEQVTSQQTPESKCVAACNFVNMLSALNIDDNTWVVSQKKVIEYLVSITPETVDVSVSPQSGGGLTSYLYLLVRHSLDVLQELIVAYLKAAGGAIDIVLSVVNTFCSANVEIGGVLCDYIFEHAIASTDNDVRRSCLMKCVEYSNAKQYGVTTRTFVFRNIVNPLLKMEVHRNGDLAQLLESCTGTAKGNTWLDAVHARIWRPSSAEAGMDEDIGTIDHYKLELLQMSALLIRTSPSLIADARKDIIKFGWNFIKLEDIVSKHSAYVLIAFFIAAYDTLSKIVVQIYVALLKTHQNEAKNLVKQALDLMAPVLPKRINSPLWAKWPRRVLSEDGHNVNQVVNIYQYIVRHAELFFDYRDHFVANIISALPKLSFVTNATSENQTLAVDLTELILKWERIAKEKGGSSHGVKRKASELEGAEGEENTTESQPTFSVPFAQREACITFLIRFVCISPQKEEAKALSRRILSILRELLSSDLWSDVTVKLTFFERSLVQNEQSEQNLPACLNALEVIAITLERRTTTWIVDNLHHLERLLEKCIKSDNSGKY